MENYKYQNEKELNTVDFYMQNIENSASFVSNNYEKGEKVLSSIEQELLSCDEFYFSVAFITKSGITPLLQTFRELEKKGVNGKIITTNYLAFSEPDALKILSDFSNIIVKLYNVDNDREGFHTKGYIFKKNNKYKIIIGSSNLTQTALTTNKEWNTRISSLKDEKITRDILDEFSTFWNSNKSINYCDFHDEYLKQYQNAKKQREISTKGTNIDITNFLLKPNKMQQKFISSMKEIIENGENRALLISATGTGKTYAAGFAMREIGYKHVLFVVHRNQIANQAKKSFERIFGDTLSTGLISGIAGKDEDYNADYIFATVQTLSKWENLHKIKNDYFDCCIYDEAHHTSASSYKRIMEYFKPKFTLGMTATPDKRDDSIEGHNIYEIYNHNIACEIRLQQAMEDDLLCPFHYFGITDLAMITDEGISSEEKIENFRFLVCEDRVKYIIEQASFYGYSGDRVKGLIFCSRVDEAKELSKKLNANGIRTVALSGQDSEDSRENAIHLLTKDLEKDENGKIIADQEYLDYIITVDIFSEGTDIVEINQVIMLRPTQSPIVFIQQLGRGLRKASGKQYVVVLDFIGNYRNNFMIPIALSGDRSYNKDTIRRYVSEGARIIPGSSTVHFDEISKKRIFTAIDTANFSDIKLIKENYYNLKNKLGRIPTLQDFDDFGEMEVFRIFDNNSLGSYYKFLVKYEKEYKVRLSADEEKVVEFISKKFANGKRVQELELINILLNNNKNNGSIKVFKELEQILQSKYRKSISKNERENIINVLTNNFTSGSGKYTYEKCIFIKNDDKNDYTISDEFSEMLSKKEFSNIVEEIVIFGINRNRKIYLDTYSNTDFVLYQKYTYEDVCRLLNWETSEVPLNIGGYKYDKKTKTFPVFINYEKSENISDSIKYEDHFIGRSTLIAISKSGRTLASEDVMNFLYAKERGIQVELFVRKNKDDKVSKEFYYLGHMTASGKTNEFIMPNTEKTAVEIEWILDRPIREDIFDYIVNG